MLTTLTIATLPNRAVAAGLLAVLLIAAPAADAREPENVFDVCRERFDKEGGKLQMATATYFGGAGAEEFTAVGVRQDGAILAMGNSWGPPFPGGITIEAVGTDAPWDVPLRIPGMDKGRDGRPLPPPDVNPNRTGFIAIYAQDLTALTKVVRFGWGTASIHTGLLARDGRLVITGTATSKFGAIARTGKLLKTFPKGTGPTYGQLLYEGTTNPGDVYVGKLSTDLKVFEWVWILQGHRKPPARLFEGADGGVWFDCQGIKTVVPGGKELRALPDPRTGTDRDLAGVDPVTGRFLVTGGEPSPTGRESWVRPIVELYATEGKLQSRVYDWTGVIVGHELLRLVANAKIEAACFLPDGRVAVCALADKDNSVLARNPVNILEPAARGGIGLTISLGRGRSSGKLQVAHLAVFDPKSYKSSCALWAAQDGDPTTSLEVDGMKGLSNGRLATWGTSSEWLVQTTGKWFAGTTHYKRIGRGDMAYRPSGWPHYLDNGGRGPYLAVWEKDFRTLAWSSATVDSVIQDVADGPGGVVAVSRCRLEKLDDGRALQLSHPDIVNWRALFAALRTEAAAAAPSPARQAWSLLSEGLKQSIQKLSPSDELLAASHAPLKEKTYAELNGLLGNKALYDAAAWQKAPLSPTDRELLGRHAAGSLSSAELAELNRRLLEHAFPQSIFRCPKSNRTPIINAVQPLFGGGVCDGHIYLVK